MEDAAHLARFLHEQSRGIAVRAPRLQTSDGYGEERGFFWFFGPLTQPELSTLGDGLYQLELLLLEVSNQHGGKVKILGKGEGGVMALLIALARPDLVRAVGALDAGLPDNLAEIPLEFGPHPEQQYVLLSSEKAHGTGDAYRRLEALGARSIRSALADDPSIAF